MAGSESLASASEARLGQWKTAFDRHYQALKQRRTVTDTQLAKEIGVTRAAFANWRSRSVPKASLLPVISLALAARDPVRARHIEQDLRQAISRGEAASGTEHPLQRVQSGTAIRVGVVQYSAFSTFFRKLTETLLQFSAVVPDDTGDGTLKDVVAGLHGFEHDVIAALFATPDRLRSMRFITTPLRLGVAEITSQALRHSDRPEKPIVTEGEVGAAYATYILQVPDGDLCKADYDELAFAELLRRFLKSETARGVYRPAIYVDEMMAMQVMVELFLQAIEDVEKRRIKDIEELEKVLPTVHVGGRESLFSPAGQQPQTHRDLAPHYNLGIAVYRPEADWYEYLQESWLIFAKSNIDYIAKRYAKLFFDLRRKVRVAQEKLEARLDRLQPPFRTRVEREVARFLDDWDTAITRWLRFDLILKAAADPNSTEPGDSSSDSPARLVVRDFRDLGRRRWRDATSAPVEAEQAFPNVSSSGLRKLRDKARLSALEYPWNAIVAMAADQVADSLLKREGENL